MGDLATLIVGPTVQGVAGNTSILHSYRKPRVSLKKCGDFPQDGCCLC